jgi:hypothetical protein
MAACGQPPGFKFTDDPWGETARDAVVSTMKLKNDHWLAIVNECKPYMPESAGVAVQSDQSRGSDAEEARPHARIDIDW